MLTAIITISSAFAEESVSEGEWFLHEFGELRSYHGDWLAVCDERGDGPCRLVQYKLEEGGDPFFGQSRMSVDQTDVDGQAGLILDFFDRGAPDEPQGPVTLEAGPVSWVLMPGRDVTKAFTPGGGTVAESFQVRKPVLVDEIVEQMRKGRWLRVGYPNGGQRKRLVFSLRGFHSGMKAIERLQASG